MLDIDSEIFERRRAGRPAVVVTVVAREGSIPSELQAKMLVDAGGLVLGTVGGGAIEHQAVADAQAALASGQPLLKEYLLDDGDPRPGDDAEPTGMLCGGRVTLFFEILAPGDRAYLFGAGHVNRALADVLTPLGFAVTFIDSRPGQLEDLQPPSGPRPHRVAPDDYTSLPELADLAASYVVIATHSHAADEVVLEQILRLGVRPRYLGVVASRRKREQIFARIRERLAAEAGPTPDRNLDLDWIHMPVGLYLGGNTPAAVALSIAAEMQACRHGIEGHRHMRDR
jgi:xanthine dehydrogenase accessory factor